MDSIGINVLHVGAGVVHIQTHQPERMHVTMSFGWNPSRSTYSGLSQDGRWAHDWSVCLTWNSVLSFSFAPSSPGSGWRRDSKCLFWTWVQIILHVSKFRSLLLSFWLLTLYLPPSTLCPDSLRKKHHLSGDFCMPLTLSEAERTKQTPLLHQEPGVRPCC